MRKPEHIDVVEEAIFNAMTPAQRASEVARYIRELADSKSFDRWYQADHEPRAKS